MIIPVKALQVSQQIGDFYIAKISAEDLVKISYSDIRELEREREVETYLGIQRPLNKSRTKEIKDYVKNYDATFPTSIILSINEENINWVEKTGLLEIFLDENESSAKILDGQHRIAGFMDIETLKPIHDLCYFERNGEFKPFELMVTIFVGLDLPEQANIFATVNLKQTKVSKSLAYDLEAYTKTRSPQKTAHDIVVALDQHDKSPFYQRIKRLGFKNGDYENLTQAMLVEELVQLISKNPMEDRDILLRESKQSFSKLRATKLEIYPFGRSTQVFRDYFINDDDDMIMTIVFSFFSMVEKKWPLAWDKKNKKSVLNRTIGVKALFRLLRDVLKSKKFRGEILKDPQKGFSRLLSEINVDDDFFINLDATSANIVILEKALKDNLDLTV